MGIDGIGSATPSYKPQIAETAEAKPVEQAPKTEPAGQASTEGFDDPKKKLMSVSGRYAPPTTTLPERQDLKDLIASQRAVSQLNDKATEAPSRPNVIHIPRSAPAADKEIDAKKPVDFMSPEGKAALIQNTSQVNPVSRNVGNHNTSCGGASLTNALVLSAKTPAEAKANADALRKTAKANAVEITPDEEKGLQAMSRGSMSPNDLAHVQQLSQRVVTPNSYGRSLSDVGNMTHAVAEIRANGGLKGARSIEFHQAKLPPPGNASHWTVSVDGTFASSLNPNGHAGATVQKGTPESQKRTADNEGWDGAVKVQNDAKPPTIELSYRKLDSNLKPVDNHMHRATLKDLEQYKTVEGKKDLKARVSHSDRTSEPITD